MDTKTQTLNPEEDGVNHINVYSKGKTELGRQLSNFAYTPFSCVDGNFDSIEGYWYWLGTSHNNRDSLRSMVGHDAKSYGRFLCQSDPLIVPDFNERIKWAIREKLWAHPQILRGLQENTLPLIHYYNFSGVVIEPKNHKWVIEFLETFKNPSRNVHGE